MVNLHKYYYLIFAGSLIVYSWYLIIYILVFNSILDAEPSKSLNRKKKEKKKRKRNTVYSLRKPIL